MKDKLKWLAAFAIPAFGYLMFETTTGNLLHISFPRAVINLLFYYFLYILVYLAVNRFRAAAAGTTVVLYILAAADYYVLQFKGAPLLLPQDLTAWRTAAAVVSHHVRKISGLRRSASYFDASADLAAAHGKADLEKARNRGGLLCALSHSLAAGFLQIRY